MDNAEKTGRAAQAMGESVMCDTRSIPDDRIHIGGSMGRISLNSLSIYILSAAIIIINIPVLSRIVGGAGILFMMLLVMAINNKKYLRRNSVYLKAALLSVVYIFYEVLYGAIGISKLKAIYYYHTIAFLFFAFIVQPILEDISRKHQNILIAASFVSLICTMLDNLRLRLLYGGRYIRLSETVEGTNAISTQYISAIVLFCGILLTLILCSKRHRLLRLVLLISMILFEIYVGQRLLAVLLLAAMMFFQLMTRRKRRVSIYAVVFFVLVLIAVMAINAEAILLWISSVINNTRLSARINQILYVIRTGKIQGAGGSLEARIRLITNSLRTFVSSPRALIFGIGDDRTSDLLIGHHSQWADQLAKFGIVGTLLLFGSLWYCFKGLRASTNLGTDDCLKKQLFIFEMYFIVRGLLGFVLYPYFGIALFVVIPILLKRLHNERVLSGEGK